MVSKYNIVRQWRWSDFFTLEALMLDFLILVEGVPKRTFKKN